MDIFYNKFKIFHYGFLQYIFRDKNTILRKYWFDETLKRFKVQF